MSTDRVVFFDTETTGLKPQEHRIISFAGIACDARTLDPIEELQIFVKIDDPRKSEREALEMHAQRLYGQNDYAPGDAKRERVMNDLVDRFVESWNNESIESHLALAKVDMFLQRHKSVKMVSKRTNAPYLVTRMGGHNIASFDIPFLLAWYGSRFCPIDAYRVLDTMHLAVWQALTCGTPSFRMSLGSLCETHGIAVDGKMHDAMVDCRATVALARVLLKQMRAAEVTA